MVVTAVIECTCCAAPLAIYYQQKSREKRRREQLAAVNDVAQKSLGYILRIVHEGTKGQFVALGADPNVSAALRAVQDYQDKNPPPSDVTLPACSAGIFGTFGGRQQSVALDVQTNVCEDAKLWLQSASGNATELADVAKRVEFYHQLLMRPEMFDESRKKRFLAVVAEVCEKLSSLHERLSGATRTCSGELSRILTDGKQFVDSAMPVLLFSIADMLEDSEPRPCTEALIAAAAGADVGEMGRRESIRTMWTTDCGRLLRTFLQQPHVRSFWQENRIEVDRSVLDVYLELWHSWEDTLDGGGTLSRSGLCREFSGTSQKGLREGYLNIYKHLDNFVRFLSVIEIYRDMADMAGDAVTYSLRAGLHHILKELEFSLAQVHQLMCSTYDAVMSTVAELSIAQGNLDNRTLQWVSGLQNMSEKKLMDSHQSLLEHIQGLRFLSSEARLPELRESLQRNIVQLRDINVSQEFRARCICAPPDAPGFVPTLADDDTPQNGRALPLADDIPRALGPEPQIVEVTDVEEPAPAPVPAPAPRPAPDQAERAVPAPAPAPAAAAAAAHQDSPVVLRPSAIEAKGAAPAPDPAERAVPAPAPAPAAAPAPDPAEREVSAPAPAPAPAVSAIITVRDENVFYTALIAACLGSDTITKHRALELLKRSGLPEQTVHKAFTIGAQDVGEVDVGTLKRLGRLVAYAQAGETDLQGVLDMSPGRLPEFRGLLWDGSRRKINVQEPL